MRKQADNKPDTPLRSKLYTIIFEADTPSGKAFDVLLIAVIIISVIVVMLDSVPAFNERYKNLFAILEWIFTILFSIEYVIRILSVRKKHKYIFSFYGIVDFLATIPSYLSILIPSAQVLLIIRVLRILRVFRVLKLAQYLSEAQYLTTALKASQRKISVFLFAVVNLVILTGSLMYVIEGAENGFTSIPKSIYWAIVTLTTVGYGDITPITDLGQFLAAIIMIMGYSIIAVPTGIVSYEIAAANRGKVCPNCGESSNPEMANYCISCGEPLTKTEA